MDIKKRIQELSLDQKAKLYFMGLVRKGVIDTLPEDPKAAYIKMVMDKADPADMHDDPGDIRIDHDYYTEEKDDYGRSISGKDKRTFVDPKDLTPAARAKKLSGMDEMQMVNKETGEDITKYVLQLLQGEISKEEFEKITGLKKETRDEEDEENDRNLAVDDIPDSLREIATKLGYLKEGIDPNSEIADYVVAMFNSSVYDYEGIQSDVWSKAEYASTSYGEGSVFMDLVDYLKSVDGKDVLEGNPDIYLELLPNEDIQWKAEVTFNENLNEEKNCGCGKNPCETYGNINESVDITYTDPGDRFYKMKVNGKRLDREEGTKYLKDLGIVDDEGKDMEIPGSYNQSILDNIVKALEKKGIKADYNAGFDPS